MDGDEGARGGWAKKRNEKEEEEKKNARRYFYNDRVFYKRERPE